MPSMACGVGRMAQHRRRPPMSQASRQPCGWMLPGTWIGSRSQLSRATVALLIAVLQRRGGRRRRSRAMHPPPHRGQTSARYPGGRGIAARIPRTAPAGQDGARRTGRTCPVLAPGHEQPGAKRGAFEDVENAQEARRIAHLRQRGRRGGSRGIAKVGKIGKDGGCYRNRTPAGEPVGQGDSGQRRLNRLAKAIHTSKIAGVALDRVKLADAPIERCVRCGRSVAQGEAAQISSAGFAAAAERRPLHPTPTDPPCRMPDPRAPGTVHLFP